MLNQPSTPVRSGLELLPCSEDAGDLLLPVDEGARGSRSVQGRSLITSQTAGSGQMSPPLLYLHFEPGHSLLGGTSLHLITRLAEALASTHKIIVPSCDNQTCL